MTKRELIIPPRLTLPIRPSLVDTVEMEVSVEEEKISSQPTRPMKRYRASGRNVRQTAFLIARIATFSLVAGDLGNMAYWYFAALPVYRYVAWVILAILWSNCISATLRAKTKKQAMSMIDTMSVRAVRLQDQWGKRTADKKSKKTPALTEDTSTFLQIVKLSLLKDNLHEDR